MTKTFTSIVGLVVALAACGGSPTDIAMSGEEMADGVATSAALTSRRAADWFPLTPGTKWTFDGEADRHEIAVKSGNQLTGLLREPIEVAYSEQNEGWLVGLNTDSRNWEPILSFAGATTWTFHASNGPCDTYRVTRDEAGDRVTFRFELDPAPNVRCAPPAIQAITVARGVGPIAAISGSGEPLHPQPDGSSEFVNGLVSSVATEKSLFVNKASTIRCIQAPCPSNEVTAVAPLDLVVRNNSAEPKALTFSSGQQFEFEIVDANGIVVKAWSDDKTFIQAETQLTLPPSGVETFSGEIELKDRNGRQLEGQFTVRGGLMTDAGLTVQSSTVIEVAIEQ